MARAEPFSGEALRRLDLWPQISEARLFDQQTEATTNLVHPGVARLMEWMTMDGMDGIVKFSFANGCFQALPACVTFIICEIL